ncbi:MAG TPA: WYL domain-containing protein [Bacillota bacterium]|nr:WYL domain-containing protein [Bacillota bacterium]
MLDTAGQDRLLTACRFFQNTAPVGVLGHFTLRGEEAREDIFTFRHLYAAQTLDDEVLSIIFTAIRERRKLSFDSARRRTLDTTRITVLPVKILTSTRTGRRYLAALNLKNNKLSTYRLDNISNPTLGEHSEHFPKTELALNKLLKRSWAVSIGQHHRDERVEMTLQIDEAREMYVCDRILREGKHGTLERVGDNTFVYKIAVLDANEMTPWLRTFIGRILSFKCSNRTMEKGFLEDIRRMYSMYGGDSPGTV